MCARPIVLITGATGFLGTHICKQFLEDGHYQVRGTTTRLGDPVKLDGLRKACGDKLFAELEMV